MSTDGGANFGPIYYDPVLVDPICAASIIRDYRTDRVYFSNAAHPTKRINMSVRRSSDWGRTWESTLLVYEGPSAYSDIIDLDSDEFIGLTWETNSTGCQGESCRTLFSFVPKNFSLVCERKQPQLQRAVTMSLPFSSYSSFDIHICWNDPSELYASRHALSPTMIDPPVHALYGL